MKQYYQRDFTCGLARTRFSRTHACIRTRPSMLTATRVRVCAAACHPRQFMRACTTIVRLIQWDGYREEPERRGRVRPIEIPSSVFADAPDTAHSQLIAHLYIYKCTLFQPSRKSPLRVHRRTPHSSMVRFGQWWHDFVRVSCMFSNVSVCICLLGVSCLEPVSLAMTYLLRLLVETVTYKEYTKIVCFCGKLRSVIIIRA